VRSVLLPRHPRRRPHLFSLIFDKESFVKKAKKTTVLQAFKKRVFLLREGRGTFNDGWYMLHRSVEETDFQGYTPAAFSNRQLIGMCPSRFQTVTGIKLAECTAVEVEVTIKPIGKVIDLRDSAQVKAANSKARAKKATTKKSK
jgi:hypothetical protein